LGVETEAPYSNNLEKVRKGFIDGEKGGMLRSGVGNGKRGNELWTKKKKKKKKKEKKKKNRLSTQGGMEYPGSNQKPNTNLTHIIGGGDTKKKNYYHRNGGKGKKLFKKWAEAKQDTSKSEGWGPRRVTIVGLKRGGVRGTKWENKTGKGRHIYSNNLLGVATGGGREEMARGESAT